MGHPRRMSLGRNKASVGAVTITMPEHLALPSPLMDVRIKPHEHLFSR